MTTVSFNWTWRNLFLLSAFCFFLYPITIDIVSVNYSFVLFPFFLLLFGGKIRRPPILISTSILVFFGIFFVASIYQSTYYPLFGRRLTSFIVFMSLFSFSFVKLDRKLIELFKLSIVVVSVYFSLVSIFIFLIINAGNTVGYEAKDLVGSQRYGFIYIAAFWIAFLFKAEYSSHSLFRQLVVLILLFGIFLTFSRSSIISLAVSLILYFLVTYSRWLVRPNLASFAKGIGIGILALLSVWLLYLFLPLTFEFYSDRIFSLFDVDVLASRLEDSGGSEGKRVQLSLLILSFIAQNPFTGSGFLGIWVLPEAQSGSAHNQYLDILFRTGFFGFLLFLLLLGRVTTSLYRTDSALFWGLMGMLVYGLVHETFKESQGAFVFAYLVGISSMTANELNDS